MPKEAALQGALLQVLQDHPRMDGFDVYVAGPGPLAEAAGHLLIGHGLPRAQLFVDTLES
jgi:hypothetical protein